LFSLSHCSSGPAKLLAGQANEFEWKSMSVRHQSDPVKRARLRWRSRRGLLENDLILTRFLDQHESTLTDDEVDALSRLLELSDNDLMDLLLSRREPEGEVDLPHVRALVLRLRSL
jgi:antitoxin CptB